MTATLTPPRSRKRTDPGEPIQTPALDQARATLGPDPAPSEAPPAAAPPPVDPVKAAMAAAIREVQSRQAAGLAADLEPYRHLVAVLADGKTPADADYAAAAVAMTALGLTPDHLQADLRTMQKYRARADRLATLPSPEETAARRVALEAELKETLAARDAARDKAYRINSELQFGSERSTLTGAVERIRAENPRLFGTATPAGLTRRPSVPGGFTPGVVR